MATRIELEYFGTANGAPVEASGRGRLIARKEEWRFQIEIGIGRVPMHWDPALIALGMLYAPLLAIDRDHGEDDSPLLVRNRALLLDENGREIGSWSESAVIEHRNSTQRWRVQLHECAVRLEHMESATIAETPWHVQGTPLGDDWTVVTATYGMSTGAGNGYRGVVTSTLYCPVRSPRVLRVDECRLAQKRTKGDGVSISLSATYVLGTPVDGAGG